MNDFQWSLVAPAAILAAFGLLVLPGARNTYTDWRKILEREKLDAVLVCTPHDYHLEPTVAALERNIHVLVEKPMTLSTKDAKAMIAAARASKAHLMAGYKYGSFPAWREVRRLIREGAIGRLRHINTVSFGNRMILHDPSKITTGVKRWIESSGPVRPFFEDIVKAGNWRGDPLRNGGGYFVDGETHSIDRMLWLAGAPAAEVSCLLTKDGFPAERALTVHAALSNGVLLSYALTNGVDADQLNLPFPKNDVFPSPPVDWRRSSAGQSVGQSVGVAEERISAATAP